MSVASSVRWRLAGLGIILFGAAAAALGLTVLRMRSAPAPPFLGAVPDFSLTERSGSTVRLADLAGKVWVADFIFTSCGGPCPMLSRRMASVQKSTAGRERVQLVSFSVDPLRDTPEVLRAYAERYAADAQRWWFLTGSRDALMALVRDGFHLATDVPEVVANDVLHSTRLVLVDPRGQIRGYYDGTEEAEAARLLADIDRLLEDD